jgi:transcriptional regulator with XRE-family HTH domain
MKLNIVYLDKICQDSLCQDQMTGHFGQTIRELRTTRQLQLRKAAAALDVDQSLLSKYERGDRLPAEDFVKRVAKYFAFDEKELIALWLSEKYLSEVKDFVVAGKALKIAEQQIKYSSRKSRA